ncbi:phosphate ABC transporter permease PstA [Halobaculum magnesiiphilum]|uniref:Phosphate transport system permease protein PstA n=1 Tax=Halobaculum magnesiiphilum TaxID=1017351 RepID=A0A8T8WBR8_9EURY|nr:phosphate ABC transporter permease PstA [Halobaculum magnesiiphilum]QZP37266.1 phosphate ABC transporter permease PstA [Halobaculum magnesiiphilum]
MAIGTDTGTGTRTRDPLVKDGTEGTGAVAAGAVGLSAVLFALSLASLFEALALTTTVAGVPLVTLAGGALVALGGAVMAFGIGSRLGYVETEPQASAGIVAGLAFAFVWFVAAGLVASQTLGLGTVGWFLVAALVGVGVFVVSTATREDVGSTLPAGALSAFAGLVFLTGAIAPGWVWNLGWAQKASFTGEFTVPVITLFVSLIAGWAAAKAYGGFGARGRHTGAYVLVYLNALSIVGVLFLLVAFTVYKGFSGAVNGFAVGPGVGPESTVVLFGTAISWEWPFYLPFVMNGVGLTNEFNGVLPAIVGTVWLVVGAVLFAVPLGVGAAVFLTEYAERGRFTQVVEVATNGLWSTPSIVFGLFGFAFLIPRFGNGKSLLAGMITLGFMLLPLVVITSREAMLAVPDEYRDASAALGVSKWQTIRSIVLPAALPGVVTGIILGVGRIAGETAPILLTMAGGVFVPGNQTADVIGGFRFTGSPPFVENPVLLDATSALPYQLYALISAGVGASGNVSNPDEFKWATAFVLLVVVLSFYAIGIAARYYFRRELNQ